MITHGSNKTTGLSNSHDDHDTPTVSQHSKDTRPPFYTSEQRTRADSAGSEQIYNHKPRLSTSVTLNTDHSEDKLSDDTNKIQHSELDETEKYTNTISSKRKVNRMTCSKESRHLATEY